MLDVLGFGTLSETTLPGGGGYNDRLLFESADVRRKAATRKRDGNQDAAYNLSAALLEAKQWDADFTTRFSEQRSYRDASHQIKYYLEHTPEDVEWGVLTNGRKWRLYGTKDYATEIYYEVDLPELLESGTLEQFKYFYAFFRPDAFRKTGGTSFLDTVWNESETAARELGEDLQDNVFTALRVLGEGFLRTNDGLELDPEDEAGLAELKEQSLVLLYRLMFVLYAESRDLIHPENPAMRDEYDQHFGLNHLRSRIHEDVQSGDDFGDYSEISTQMWGRLDELFALVDEGEESLGIPPYNGGLFDADDHEFLAEHAVADRYIAEVIYRIGTTETEDGEFVLADYADLDTRHLGTIYEGLLEHEFRIAPEEYAAVSEDGGQVWKPATEVSVADAVETVDEGDLYVVNDDGERKATGAYYTPDYIVAYIVEESVGSLVDDIEADLRADGLDPSETEYFRRFWQGVLDLKILDPAMGSAHFLTAATGYLTARVMGVVREQEIQGYDEQDLRREIARECIYGVDINGIAVELAKLSMWLETLAADQPLAFLDHHLKTGNSLIGSDIEDVLGDESDQSGQTQLTDWMDQTRQRALEHVLDRFSDLLSIDNETLGGIKEMEEVYAEIREDSLYRHLLAMVNVHTASDFGLDVPDDAEEQMAEALRDDSWDDIENADWFREAQAMAKEEGFFHWQLEFPVVFYGGDGERLEDPGFDAVIGNPPYVEVGDSVEGYLRSTFEVPEYFVDLFHVFIERGVQLLSENSEFGYIVPEPWLTMENTSRLRQFLLTNTAVEQVVRFESTVFDEATVDTIILTLRKTDDLDRIRVLRAENEGSRIRGITETNQLDQESLLSTQQKRIEVRQTAQESEILDRIRSASVQLDEIADVSIGIQAYNRSKHTEEQIENRVFHADNKESEEYLPELSGQDVSRYSVKHDGETWVKYGDHLHDYRPMRYFSAPRILVREITDSGRHKIHAAYTEETYCNYKTILNILPTGDYSAKYLLAVLNSTAMSWIFLRTSNKVVSDTFPRISVTDLEGLDIPRIDFSKSPPLSVQKLEELFRDYLRTGDSAPFKSVISDMVDFSSGHPGVLHDFLRARVDDLNDWQERRSLIDLPLLDYLGNYTKGPNLPDIGLFQPTSSNILDATAEDYEKLRVGDVETERDGSSVTVSATARYKPEDEDAFETDQWGYAETGYEEAFTLTDLTEVEAALVEAFVPVAAEEADGFAGFRDNATKTNSPIDRLKAITLPDPDDVADDLERYFQAKERADELDEKIEKTDDLIDDIVYDLYGLSEEEIEIVESSVRND
uniref:Eco57I restriction-modification methylase domain-containing protein n=1 Tax=Halocalculus aciditolerans TaxID=1383812 RepID=UPI001E4451DE|nr:N-6 DNA methylase [Halocalculus aciditolerans]